MPTTPLRLAFFFTRNVSLRTWAESGSFEREVAIHRRLSELGVAVGYITYGRRDDLDLAHRLPGIPILCNRHGLPARLYERLVPLLHGRFLRGASVLMTNQTNGSEIALRCSRLWRKPLVARCGYMWSLTERRRGAEGEAQRAAAIERQVFPAATRVVVTTGSMRDYARESYGLDEDRVEVIPNYVLTDELRPAPAQRRPDRLVFVGRLSPEKNPYVLLDAIDGLDVELTMVGDGPLRADLEREIARRRLPVELLGSRPHEELPAIFNRASIALLVSRYEGHPKTLLEAMSCGLAVIGADAPGIREVIEHERTGLLCAAEPAAIRGAIRRLLAEPDLRARLGQAARASVVANLSLLARIAERQLAVLRQCAEVEGA